MNQNQKTRVILYSRVAAPPIDTEPPTVLDQHLAELRDDAAGRGWQVVAEFSDTGSSGFKLKRPGLTALRRAVATGTADVVLVYDLTRLSRSLNHTLTLFDEFGAAGTGVASVREAHLDFTTAVGRASLNAITALNRHDQDQPPIPR